MDFFIDSADIAEIKHAASYNVISGVTTNPSLISKTKANFYSLIEEICSLIPGPISVEATEVSSEEMILQGQKILEIAGNVVLKLPMTWNGIKVCRHFVNQGKQVNMTLCFSASQALIAAKAGATYVSPFIGRLEDRGYDGMKLIKDIVDIFNLYKLPTKVLAASVRNPYHLYKSALGGAHVATMSLNVINQLITHPLTDEGLEKFSQDWHQYNLSI